MLFMIVLRALFVVLAFFVGWEIAFPLPEAEPGAKPLGLYFPILMAALALCLILVEVVFQPKYRRALVAVFAGLVLGLFVTFILTSLIRAFLPEYGVKFLELLGPVMTLFLCYLTVTIVFQTKDQFRFMIPYVDFSHQGRRSGGLVVDSSALIDGRLVELAGTQLVDSEIKLPRFVVRELRALADSKDRQKRQRGRRGLDMVNRLQCAPKAVVRMLEIELQPGEEVDQKLVETARRLDGKLVTTDLNLGKVARIHGVEVININDVAAAMRPAALPGQTLRVQIVREGEQKGQGIGFLEDGTMVVVEEGKQHLDRECDIEVTGLFQSAAGRMIFAKLLGSGEKATPTPRRASPERNAGRNRPPADSADSPREARS